MSNTIIWHIQSIAAPKRFFLTTLIRGIATTFFMISISMLESVLLKDLAIVSIFFAYISTSEKVLPQVEDPKLS